MDASARMHAFVPSRTSLRDPLASSATCSAVPFRWMCAATSMYSTAESFSARSRSSSDATSVMGSLVTISAAGGGGGGAQVSEAS